MKKKPAREEKKALMDREALLAAVRRAIKAAGGKRLTFNQFVEQSGIRPMQICRNFARWTDVLRAAGFNFERDQRPYTSERLLEDWGVVARELGRAPTLRDYRVRGKHDVCTIAARFGCWRKVCEAFLAFAEKKTEWADVKKMAQEYGAPGVDGRKIGNRVTRVATRASATAELLPKPESALRGGVSEPVLRTERKWRIARKRLQGASVYGVPLDFGPLRHAPVNEQGVVFLFALMAERLGFLVQSLRSTYPDCEAMRRIEPEVWQRVRIEFEFESRNFLQHGHDPEDCDLIVCWKHNWPECPKNIEVIDLSKEIDRHLERA